MINDIEVFGRDPGKACRAYSDPLFFQDHSAWTRGPRRSWLNVGLANLAWNTRRFVWLSGRAALA